MENFLREGVDMQGITGRTIAGDAHFFEDATTPAKVRAYLDSTKEVEKLKGMKWLLAMLSKGRDVSEFFADVVKNVVVKSIEVKKMVYLYLVHYADYDHSCREIALLSINSFQKDLAGSNPLIRGLALRVMTSIRVPDIIQIQLLAVRKCATDSSPYVRKCAATALAKIHALDPEQLSNLKQLLEKLLKDSSTMVLGSAVAAFNEICPTSYDVIHRSYRKLCHLLADMDEWTQIVALEVFTRYLRDQFTDPAPGVAAAIRLQAKQRSTSALRGNVGNTIKRRVVKKAFYSDEEDESEEEDVEVRADKDKPEIGSVFTGGDADHEGDLDPDHRLALRSCLPLLKSRNSGVVLGVCALHYYCGSQGVTTTQQIAKALVRILRNKREIQYVVLTCINAMAQQRPAMFRPFLSEFLVKSTDPIFNRLLKLDVLAYICTKENTQTILRELQIYIKHSNNDFVRATIRAVGRIADANPEVAPKCMEGLLHLMACHKSKDIVGECVIVLRQLIQQNSGSEGASKMLHHLTKMLISEGVIEDAVARASVVWLVGEYHDILQKIAPDVLRILASSFPDEATEVKIQILNFAIKLSLRLAEDENVQNLMTYILEMARYDLDTDLRDRSRFMTALMGLAPSNEAEGGENSNAQPVDEAALEELAEHAMGIMLAPKLPPVTLLGSVDVEGLPNFNLGSLSSLMGHHIKGYQPLPGWPDVQPDPNVRDVIRLTGAEKDEDPNMFKKGKKTRKGSSDDEDEKEDLTGFYGEESDSSSSGSDSSSDSDSDSDSDDDSDSDSSSSSSSSSDDDDSSSSGSSSDDDSDSDNDSDSKSKSGRSSSDDSDSDSDSDGEVARIPLNASPAKSVMKQGMRKVAQGGGRRPGAGAGSGAGFMDDPVDLSGMLTSTTSSFGSMALESAAPPGAAAAAAVADFGDDFTSLFPSTVTLDPSTLGPTDSGKDMSSSSAMLPNQTQAAALQSVMSVPLNPQMMNPAVGGAMGMAGGAMNMQQQQQQMLGMSNMGNMGMPGAAMGQQPQGGVGGNMGMNMGMNMMGNNMGMGNMGAQNMQGMGMNQGMGQMGMGQMGMMGQQMGQMGQQQTGMGAMNMGAMNMGMGQGMGAGGMAMGGPQAAYNRQQNAPMPQPVMSQDLSEPKVILRPEIGGGLAVSLVLRHGVQPVAYMGAHCAFVLIQNTKDHAIRRVKVSFPADVRRTQLEDIPVPNPGQQITMPLEIVLAGLSGKQIRVDVRSDVGAFMGAVTLEGHEILFPTSMAPSDFDSARKRLGGFAEASKSFPPVTVLGGSTDGVADIESALVAKVKKLFNVYVVQGAGVGELMFAGASRKAGGVMEEKVLITVTSDGEQATFRFNCEDAVLATGATDWLKRLFSKGRPAAGSPR